MEIVRDLDRFPSLRSHEPRKVIELIQTIEKALHDLTELNSADVIKYSLMTRSIESKLPDYMKRDWVRFMRKPSKGVTAENYFNSLLKYLKDEEATLEHLEQLEKIFFWKQFKELESSERLRAIEQLGACRRCFLCHTQGAECKSTYLCRNGECSSDHHFLLCTRGG